MAASAPSVDALWAAFRSLPPESRDRFLERVVADQALRQNLEDLLDLEVARDRAREPTRPLEDVLAELDES